MDEWKIEESLLYKWHLPVETLGNCACCDVHCFGICIVRVRGASIDVPAELIEEDDESETPFRLFTPSVEARRTRFCYPFAEIGFDLLVEGVVWVEPPFHGIAIVEPEGKNAVDVGIWRDTAGRQCSQMRRDGVGKLGLEVSRSIEDLTISSLYPLR